MEAREYDESALRKWFDDNSQGYDQRFVGTESQYGGDFYRSEVVAGIIRNIRPKRVLDIGCGTSIPMINLLKEGYDVVGFDLSPGMIETARENLVVAGFEPDRAQVGNLFEEATVVKYQSDPFDAVIVNGVFPYFEDTCAAYENICKFINTRGHYISSYLNKLFDLFTLNSFTIKFHENILLGLDISDDIKKRVMENIRNLITNSDKPTYIELSARNEIYSRGDNPLTIKVELNRFGLDLKDIYFYRFHVFPPLIRDLDNEILKAFNHASRSLEVEHAKDWRGYFMASGFITQATKTT